MQDLDRLLLTYPQVDFVYHIHTVVPQFEQHYLAVRGKVDWLYPIDKQMNHG